MKSRTIATSLFEWCLRVVEIKLQSIVNLGIIHDILSTNEAFEQIASESITFMYS